MSLRFPEDEAVLPWLSMLLDAYDITNENVRTVMEKDIQSGLSVACSSGCGMCCSCEPIPLTSLELSGIIWFIRRKMYLGPRQRIEESIKRFSGKVGCPMLIDEKCSIYPMRPIACRHFNVYERTCEPGEEVMDTRPEHVLKPDHDKAQAAYRAMLPYYGITDPKLQEAALQQNYLFKNCSVFMHMVDWDALLVHFTVAD
ncbi:YkgJ family cysteine cluster protein [Pseudodesulfovibrio sp. zrk46]|uniref:YkgJ family cysteine cluster protein n=1 Tax=Pseudodesulfovibrio sp. zrk46 TaxID=2725288 RepID=UPI001449B040|nr:YkgJ family cysteine cluster protein [Pseudodesulfovibrio sp. zrk46]QJB56507.1 YkgJ family cysteine cluster protein [Pseudodesulfovibrio sp. zrk46]